MPQKRGLSRKVVFGNRFNYIEKYDLLARTIWSFKTSDLSMMAVVSLRHVSLYPNYQTITISRSLRMKVYTYLYLM